MCGIVGYSGKRDAVGLLTSGLSKLEYRGYDSAGIAVCKADGTVEMVKSKGRLAILEEKLANKGLSGNAGIGHTRWATHGEPSDANSHPHRSGRVTLVHNGIIENYMQLKEELIAEGKVFLSDTDTEVVVALIDRFYEEDPIEAIYKTTAVIRGSYALGVMFDDIPNTIYAIRKDSPLVIGVGKDEVIIASDIPAFLSETRDYYLLDEGELAIVRDGTVSFCDATLAEHKKELLTASWDVEAAEKGGYPHFMLKEMHEQPKTLKDTVFPRIDEAGNILKNELKDTSYIKRIHIVGCGSAMHAGLLGKAFIEKYARVPVSVEIASEFRYANPVLGEGDVIVLISQSGETADSLAVIKLAKELNIPTVGIVNVVGSSIARAADTVIYTNAGPEIAVATTKAYTAQVSVLYLLGLRLAADRGTIGTADYNAIVEALKLLPEAAKKVLENEEHYKELAKEYFEARDMFFIGRGQDSALCCEGSLKLKEISYMHSEAYAAGELKHGTISLISEGVPVVAVATTEAMFEKTVSNIKEVTSRGADVIFVTQFDDVGGFYKDKIALPAIHEAIMPILAIIPLQLFAYYVSIERGCDVDKPRNLAKSVTVE
ncbi:MAG: glutamine--fructose-6-phosphate transaminase (isomerizing) [Clostridia bacterium]|nr:glutamine--fructose-6-phosphate transaminase (isomerizing) [Clostridia bacterium]